MIDLYRQMLEEVMFPPSLRGAWFLLLDSSNLIRPVSRMTAVLLRYPGICSQAPAWCRTFLPTRGSSQDFMKRSRATARASCSSSRLTWTPGTFRLTCKPGIPG